MELLLARGDEVCIVARQRYPEVEALGAEGYAIDIRDTDSLKRALCDVDVLFHVAGKTGVWGSARDFEAINVDGTRSVLAAARGAGVSRLVFTSSPSVVGYDRDVENGGPDLPYATRHESHYAASKASAERLVLAANSPDFATIALRPHLVIGERDNAMLPKVVASAAKGRLRVVGAGRNRVDLTDVENAAWAHLDAAEALAGPNPRCVGRSYFISNGEPVLLWPWLFEVLDQLNIPVKGGSIPCSMARAVGMGAEWLWRTFPLPDDPPITRFLASALARSHWYDMGPAGSDIGYHVRVDMQEATRRAVAGLAGWKREAATSP